MQVRAVYFRVPKGNRQKPQREKRGTWPVRGFAGKSHILPIPPENLVIAEGTTGAVKKGELTIIRELRSRWEDPVLPTPHGSELKLKGHA